MKITSPVSHHPFYPTHHRRPSPTETTDRRIDRARARGLARVASYLQPPIGAPSIDRSIDRVAVPAYARRSRTPTTTHPIRARVATRSPANDGRTNGTERNGTNDRSIEDDRVKKRAVCRASNRPPGNEPRGCARRTHTRARASSIYTYRRSRQRRAGAERRRTVRHHGGMG